MTEGKQYTSWYPN